MCDRVSISTGMQSQALTEYIFVLFVLTVGERRPRHADLYETDGAFAVDGAVFPGRGIPTVVWVPMRSVSMSSAALRRGAGLG